MNRQIKADIELIFVTMAWGFSYFMTDVCLVEMDTFTLNAYRFVLAFILAVVLAFPRLKAVNKKTILHAAGIAVLLLAVYTCSTLGVKYTSISNTGFLCSLSVIFIPILTFVIKKEKPDKKLLAAIIICVIGIAMLTLNEQFRMAWGDVICIMGSVFASFYLMSLDSALKSGEIPSFHMSVFLFGFMGIYCTVLAFLFEEPKLPQAPSVMGAVVFLGVVCTLIALVVQTHAQAHTSAAHVGVIFCLEPVFSAMVAYFLAGEVLLPRAYVGAVLMVLSVIVMEVDFLPKKKIS